MEKEHRATRNPSPTSVLARQSVVVVAVVTICRFGLPPLTGMSTGAALVLGTIFVGPLVARAWMIQRVSREHSKRGRNHLDATGGLDA